MDFNQAVQVAKEAMRARVAVLIFPRKWDEGEFGVEFQHEGTTRARESYVEALDTLDALKVAK
jgi:hypothetical protein